MVYLIERLSATRGTGWVRRPMSLDKNDDEDAWSTGWLAKERKDSARFVREAWFMGQEEGDASGCFSNAE